MVNKIKKEKLVEIARSFSRKLNTGDYTTCDFFCSAKQEVPEEEARETSKQLFSFCKEEVEKDVLEYQTRALKGILTDTEKHVDMEKVKEVEKLEANHLEANKVDEVRAEIIEADIAENLPVINSIDL